MTDQTGNDSRSHKLPIEVERELFIVFWKWLAIVGGAVIVVASGFAIVASLSLKTFVNERVEAALIKIADIEKRALDSAQLIGAAQGRSVARAEDAERITLSLQEKLKTLPDIDKLAQSTQTAVQSAINNPDFQSKVVAAVNKIQILAALRVRSGSLLEWTAGVTFVRDPGTVTFPNPRQLKFVPIVTDSQDNTYITDTHWVRSIQAPNIFTVRAKALDTGGAERTSPPHDFTAIVLGFEGS